MLTIGFPECTVRISFANKRIETEFADGAICEAEPQDTDAYRFTAEQLGYGSDTWRMCYEHELAHTLLAIADGLPYSQVLWDVAHGQEGLQSHVGEESAVLTLQRDINHRRSKDVHSIGSSA
jgi:hypothetical protein